LLLAAEVLMVVGWAVERGRRPIRVNPSVARCALAPNPPHSPYYSTSTKKKKKKKRGQKGPVVRKKGEREKGTDKIFLSDVELLSMPVQA
jgi:hypothetical protein